VTFPRTAPDRTAPDRTAPAAPAAPRGTALLTTTRVLAGIFGALKLSSTVFFLFFASAEAGGDPQGAGDWTVGVWSIVVALGYLAVAARLGRDGRRLLPAVAALTVADLAFSAVKFLVYDESAAIGFTATTLVLFVLVALSTRPRRA
jgi:hypothetical protein